MVSRCLVRYGWIGRVLWGSYWPAFGVSRLGIKGRWWNGLIGGESKLGLIEDEVGDPVDGSDMMTVQPHSHMKFDLLTAFT